MRTPPPRPRKPSTTHLKSQDVTDAVKEAKEKHARLQALIDTPAEELPFQVADTQPFDRQAVLGN